MLAKNIKYNVWKVHAAMLIWIGMVCGSCEDIFEPDLTNNTVVLLSPADSLKTNDSVMQFHWQDTRSLAEYQLQIVSPSFDSIVEVYADTITAANQLRLRLNANRWYQWRVRPVNYSSEGLYSRIRNFYINEPAP